MYCWKLFVLMETRKLLEQSEQKFYSPWREDPRPLSGLFHGIYVFSAIANFYERIETISSMKNCLNRLRQRRSLICHRLRLAIEQLPEDKLTTTGKKIVQSINEELDRHDLSLGHLNRKLPFPLRDHLRRWSEDNKELSISIKIPLKYNT